MRAAEEADRTASAAAAAQRAISSATTQSLSIVRIPPREETAPVGARFYRPRRGAADEQTAAAPPAPAPAEVPAPASSAAPTGARFYRERKTARHRP